MDDALHIVTLRGANEFTYCPRLFWLEWVAGEFEGNEHTAQGEHVHRRVDRPGGKLAAPEDEDAPWESRSLWLSDAELGISGKLDLVETDGDEVMPVDTKKGRPTREKTLWPADRVQLTLQGVLLRAAGYRVSKIAVYYDSVRRRVVEPLTIANIDEALGVVAQAREVLRTKKSPPPLVDSPKCRGCSLHAICMPDETNALLGKGGAPRQVLVPRTDAWPGYVATAGARVGKSMRELVVKPPASSDEPEVRLPLDKLSELNLLGGVQITTQAMQACMDRDIPVRFFSYGGWYYGRATGFASRNVAVRIAQFRAFETDVALHVARVLIADKIHNSRVLLQRNASDDVTADVLRPLKRIRGSALGAESAAQLLGFEGEAARTYWSGFDRMVRAHDERLAMRGRNRRPPEDPVNALLSFTYALLVKDCVRAIEAAGLDPFLGLYHTPHHGRPALALDLMEPFRPLIADSVVLQVIRRNEIGVDGFVRTGQAVRMKDRARKDLIAAYERRMGDEVAHPVFQYRASYRRTLAIQARLLARYLTGEIDAYPAFRTR